MSLLTVRQACAIISFEHLHFDFGLPCNKYPISSDIVIKERSALLLATQLHPLQRSMLPEHLWTDSRTPMMPIVAVQQA